MGFQNPKSVFVPKSISKKTDEDIYCKNFFYFNPQAAVYGFAILFVSTNFRRKLDYRYYGGTGFTWQVVRTKKHLSKIANGLLYEEAKFKGNVFNDEFYDGNSKIDVFRSSHW